MEEQEQKQFDFEDVKHVNYVDENNVGDDTSTSKLEVKCAPPLLDIDTNGYKKYYLRETKPCLYVEEATIKEKNTSKSKTKKCEVERRPKDSLFLCNICDFTSSSEIGYTAHKNCHIKNTNKFKCDICKQEFSTNTLLKNHKYNHKEEIFLCKKCKLAFSNHRVYLTHKTNHMKKPPYKCYECEYEFVKLSSLKCHIKIHYADIEVQCPICKNNIEKRFLTNHIRNHSASECVECHKLVSKQNMDYHMVMHTGLKPIQCLYCGKGFSNTCQRRIHTRIHTGSRPYKCEICEQKFHQYTDLQKHLVSKHSSERYECDTCGKRYKHKHTLAMHIRTHTNYTPYKCPKCQSKFTMLQSLKCHFYLRHIKEKRFGCEICGSEFKTLLGLQKHKKSKVHKRKEYKLNNI